MNYLLLSVLFQLAGVVAVEVTGGPDIVFVPGRKDSNVCPKEGRLPDAKQGTLNSCINYNKLFMFSTDNLVLELEDFFYEFTLFISL
jgi:hypothetical protein